MTMATIVPLPARRQGAPASVEQEGGAIILFFTGVRYVRETEADLDDDEAEPAPAKLDETAGDTRAAI
jgi:hypothetical protein